MLSPRIAAKLIDNTRRELSRISLHIENNEYDPEELKEVYTRICVLKRSVEVIKRKQS